jgi:hypothetical protein
MLRPKTYFEQVPLEIVQKIVEKEDEQEKTTIPARGSKKKKLREDVVAPSRVNGRNGKV